MTYRRSHAWYRLPLLVGIVALLAVAAAGCEETVTGQVLFAGDRTATSSASRVTEVITFGSTGLLTTVNTVDDVQLADTNYWAERLPALAASTRGFDAVVLSLGINDVEDGEMEGDLAGQIDTVVGLAAAASTKGVLWATLNEATVGHEEGAAAFNAALRATASDRPELRVLEFGAELEAHPDYLADDGIRWSPTGQQAFAEMVDAELTTLVDPPVALLTVEKVADEDSVVVGDQIHLHVTVTNAGEVALHGVDLDDVAAPGCDAAPIALEPGASLTVDCTHEATRADVPTYTNVATVDADEIDPVASDPVEVAISDVNVLRIKKRIRGNAPDAPEFAIRVRCRGEGSTDERIVTVGDQNPVDLVFPAAQNSCVVHEVDSDGAATVVYLATSSTGQAVTRPGSGRIVFPAGGGASGKVRITNTHRGTCPPLQPYC